MSELTKIGWMCKTDFDYHVEGDTRGTEVYPTLDELKARRPCVKEGDHTCGIVKVTMTAEVIKPGW